MLVWLDSFSRTSVRDSELDSVSAGGHAFRLKLYGCAVYDRTTSTLALGPVAQVVRAHA